LYWHFLCRRSSRVCVGVTPIHTHRKFPVTTVRTTTLGIWLHIRRTRLAGAMSVLASRLLRRRWPNLKASDCKSRSQRSYLPRPWSPWGLAGSKLLTSMNRLFGSSETRFTVRIFHAAPRLFKSEIFIVECGEPSRTVSAYCCSWAAGSDLGIGEVI
jgi:hypothetical protein